MVKAGGFDGNVVNPKGQEDTLTKRFLDDLLNGMTRNGTETNKSVHALMASATKEKRSLHDLQQEYQDLRGKIQEIAIRLGERISLPAMPSSGPKETASVIKQAGAVLWILRQLERWLKVKDLGVQAWVAGGASAKGHGTQKAWVGGGGPGGAPPQLHPTAAHQPGAGGGPAPAPRIRQDVHVLAGGDAAKIKTLELQLLQLQLQLLQQQMQPPGLTPNVTQLQYNPAWQQQVPPPGVPPGPQYNPTGQPFVTVQYNPAQAATQTEQAAPSQIGVDLTQQMPEAGPGRAGVQQDQPSQTGVNLAQQMPEAGPGGAGVQQDQSIHGSSTHSSSSGEYYSEAEEKDQGTMVAHSKAQELLDEAKKLAEKEDLDPVLSRAAAAAKKYLDDLEDASKKVRKGDTGPYVRMYNEALDMTHHTIDRFEGFARKGWQLKNGDKLSDIAAADDFQMIKHFLGNPNVTDRPNDAAFKLFLLVEDYYRRIANAAEKDFAGKPVGIWGKLRGDATPEQKQKAFHDNEEVFRADVNGLVLSSMIPAYMDVYLGEAPLLGKPESPAAAKLVRETVGALVEGLGEVATSLAQFSATQTAGGATSAVAGKVLGRTLGNMIGGGVDLTMALRDAGGNTATKYGALGGSVRGGRKITDATAAALWYLVDTRPREQRDHHNRQMRPYSPLPFMRDMLGVEFTAVSPDLAQRAQLASAPAGQMTQQRLEQGSQGTGQLLLGNAATAPGNAGTQAPQAAVLQLEAAPDPQQGHAPSNQTPSGSPIIEEPPDSMHKGKPKKGKKKTVRAAQPEEVHQEPEPSSAEVHQEQEPSSSRAKTRSTTNSATAQPEEVHEKPASTSLRRSGRSVRAPERYAGQRRGMTACISRRGPGAKACKSRR